MSNTRRTLKAAILGRGFTARGFATAAGIPRRTLYRLFDGEDYTTSTARKVADALGVSLDQLEALVAAGREVDS